MLLHFCSFSLLLLLAERFEWPGCYALSGTVRPEDGDDADEDGNDDPSTTAAEPKPGLLKQKEKGKPNA
jgi:hypothetical protein